LITGYRGFGSTESKPLSRTAIECIHQLKDEVKQGFS
jgi:hypothetical protein